MDMRMTSLERPTRRRDRSPLMGVPFIGFAGLLDIVVVMYTTCSI